MTLIVILMIVIFVKLIGRHRAAERSDSRPTSSSCPAARRSSALVAGVGVRLPVVRRASRARRRWARRPTTRGARSRARSATRCWLRASSTSSASWSRRWGFGADAAGAKAFATSSSPLGDLAPRYIGSWMSDLINLGRDDQRLRQRPGRRPTGARGSCSRSAGTRSVDALGRLDAHRRARGRARRRAVDRRRRLIVVQRLERRRTPSTRSSTPARSAC